MARIDLLIGKLESYFEHGELHITADVFQALVEPFRSKKSKRPNPKRKTLRKGKQTREEIAEVRHLLYLRANGFCEAGDSPKCMGRVAEHIGEAAHIASKSRGGRFELSNLLWKCGPCHRWEHNGGKPCPPKPKGNE